MKSKLVYLSNLSGKKASVYSIISEESQYAFLDRFIMEYQKEFFQDLLSIVGRLKTIGNVTGAVSTYFKLDEGLEWNDLVCALYDIPDRHLRLYCIRLNEQMLIVGGGGPKSVRAWQHDPKLTREVHEMMHYSKIIRARLKDDTLRISLNRLKLEGDLLLIR